MKRKWLEGEIIVRGDAGARAREILYPPHPVPRITVRGWAVVEAKDERGREVGRDWKGAIRRQDEEFKGPKVEEENWQRSKLNKPPAARQFLATNMLRVVHE